jgi:hypothetical protein
MLVALPAERLAKYKSTQDEVAAQTVTFEPRQRYTGADTVLITAVSACCFASEDE